MKFPNITIHLTNDEAVTLQESLRYLQRQDGQGGNFAFIGRQREHVANICRKVEQH